MKKKDFILNKQQNLKFLIISLLLLTQFSYGKNNDSILGTIFKNFATGVLSEVSEHAGKETAKLFLADTVKEKNKSNTKNIEKTLLNVVSKWNDAVGKRDTDTLFNLYGYKVLYYGSKLSDKKCIDDKNRFYKKYPYFSQSIEDIKYEKISTNLYKVFFNKHVRMKKSKPIKNYPSYLVIDTSYSSPLIMVEGDKVTDKILLKRYKNK